MPRIVVSDIISNSKFNRFFLITFTIGALTQMFDGYDAAVFGVAAPLLMKSLKLNPTQTGILASWGMFGMFFGAFAFGVLGDYIGRKRAVMLATFMYSFFTGMSGLTSGFTDFAIYRFIAGVGLSGLGVNVISLISEYSPQRNRTTMTSVATIGMAVGAVLCSLVGLVLMTQYGWRMMFYSSFCVMPLLVFQYFFLPDTMVQYVKLGQTRTISRLLGKADPTFKPSPDDEYVLRTADKGRTSILKLFQDGFAKNTILFFLLLFLDYFVIYGMTTCLPKLMMQRGHSLSSSLWLASLFNFGGLVGVPFAGWLADRFGIKKACIWYFIGAAIVIGSLWAEVSFPMLLALLFLSGAGQHGVQGLMNAYVVQSYPLYVRSTAMGTTFTVGRLGGVVGPIVLGVLMTMQASLMTVFMVIASAFVINIFLVAFTSDFTRSANYAKPGETQKAVAHA